MIHLRGSSEAHIIKMISLETSVSNYYLHTNKQENECPYLSGAFKQIHRTRTPVTWYKPSCNLLYTLPGAILFVVPPTVPSTSEERAVVPSNSGFSL